jgi:lipoprotein-anchoring transpeptidase ErfK/SrfK
MSMTLGKVVAAGAISPFALVPAVAAPATASAVTPASPVTAGVHPTLHYGDHGAAVKLLQQRLTALHYDPGRIDGKYGLNTRFAVWALQKVDHLTPSSTVGPKTWAALDHPRVLKPLVPKGGKSRAEVDIKHQLLYIYRNGRLVLISHISSGSDTYYYSGGRREKAHTPRGNFRVYRKAGGWETSPLGRLYKADYFHGGYAIHGEPEVPLYPASHGCVRTPMHTADIVAGLLTIGTPVYVRG